jgi:hypothetical protein
MNSHEARREAAAIECKGHQAKYLRTLRRLETTWKALRADPGATAEYEAAKHAYREAREAYNDCLKIYGLDTIT